MRQYKTLTEKESEEEEGEVDIGNDNMQEHCEVGEMT